MSEKTLKHLKHSELTGLILREYFGVFKRFGYGFTPEIYKNSLAATLKQVTFLELKIEIDQPLDVYYEMDMVGQIHLDLVINQKIIVLVTATDKLELKNLKRLTNYLKISDYEVGLLLNYGEKLEYKRRDKKY